jgi:hypothetical protein
VKESYTIEAIHESPRIYDSAGLFMSLELSLEALSRFNGYITTDYAAILDDGKVEGSS